MAFDRPWMLWVAAAAAALVLGTARRGLAGPAGPAGPAGLAPWRRIAAALLRAAGVVLACAAAAGPHARESPERARRTVLALAGSGAGESLPAAAPGESPPGTARGESVPRAVAAALASAGPGEDVRVLLRVGAIAGEDEGEAAGALRAARGLGVPVLVEAGVPAPAPPAPAPSRPWLRGIGLPPVLASGVPFEVRPILGEEGTGPGDAVLSLSVDGRPAGSWSPGRERPPVVSLSAGHHVLALEVRDGAGVSRGAASATVAIPGPPRVLLLEEGAAPSAFGRALAAQGLEVVRAAPGSGPVPGAHAVVVLGAGAGGDEDLERAVRGGTGLLVLGAAEEARGLGRLRGSPVEKALPVFLPPPLPAPPPPDLPPEPEPPPPGPGPEVKRDEGERPGAVVTLLLVVDSSGSMAGPKLEMARRAALAAAATLSPADRFGLLSFSDEARWGVPLRAAGETAAIERALRSLRAGGGTNLLPALQEARRALRAEKTAVRHVLVLSDGETSPFGLRPVVEGMAGEGATLSTVGIGIDFDARLLGNLSLWGHGRTFPAVDPETLPQVVTLDARRLVEAGKEQIARARPTDLPAPPSGKEPPREKPPEAKPPPGPPPGPPARVAVAEGDPCALLEGLGPWPAAVPPGAAAEPRLATTLALRFAGSGGPALVLGRHGLGRTAVLPFDPADWESWEGFGPAAARLVRGLAPADAGAPADLLGAEAVPGGTRVRFEVPGHGVLDLPGVEVLDPEGDSPAGVPVEREGARRFAALVPAGSPGPRTLVIRTAGPPDPGAALGYFDPGPAPPAPPDGGLPARLAEASGAVLVRPGEPLPPFPSRPGEPRRIPGGFGLLAAAAILLAADAALRRAGTR